MKAVRTILAIVGLLAIMLIARVGFDLAKAYRRQSHGRAEQQLERHRYPQWAAARGLRYVERDDDRLAGLVRADDGPLRAYRGLGCELEHVFGGSADPDERAFFQLGVVLRPGNVPVRMFQTVAIARLPTPTAELVIRPRRARSDRASSVPIGDAAFDSAYVVRTEEPEWGWSLLDRELAQLMAAFPEGERPTVRLTGQWVICSLEGPLRLDRAKRLDDLASAVLDRL